jgi:sulfite reductase (NADPH) flavoprotein alpha-component
VNATSAQYLPLTPLDPERAELLARVIDGLDAPVLQWLSGFTAGLALARSSGPAQVATAHALAHAPAARPDAPAAASSRLAIVYGSQTGNGRRVAERLGRAAEAAGLATRVYAAGDYPLKDLARERLLVVVMSTHGDGDPPDDARPFLDYLNGKRAPKLEQLSYSVLALGDSSYPKFCESGRVVDERLAALGAQRLLPRVDCDLDYEKLAGTWAEQTLATARDALGAQPLAAHAAVAPALATVTRLRTPPAAPTWTRENPFEAELLANQRITGRDASKDTRHVEISLAGSGLSYEPGDALGVWHENPAAVVDALLAAAALDGTAPVEFEGRTRPLREWLTTEREITRLTRPFVLQHASRSGSQVLASALEHGNEESLRRLLKDLQPIDLLQRHPAAWSPAELVAALRPLAPRMYSIASSPDAVGDEVHLTVAVVDYEQDGERRYGGASKFIADTDVDSGRLRVFIEPNERFRLPADPSKDVIMIGPGTGVAPFRAFVQRRAASGAAGRNWLFFGARHFASEFLYQLEWQDAVKKGHLHRLDVAFSRDKAPKSYVQDRIVEQGKELFAWLEGGAYLYVCGDADRMAPDVEAALVDVVAEHGGYDRESAQAYVRRLADERRYLRDVY